MTQVHVQIDVDAEDFSSPLLDGYGATIADALADMLDNNGGYEETTYGDKVSELRPRIEESIRRLRGEE